MPQKKLTDIDPMPFGKYRNVKMIDVPASYLLWYLENGLKGNVMDYCIENKEVLLQEIKEQKK
jgi:uncharacterized protein (DUF3820 family)